MLWPTWPWSPRLTSLASLFLPSLASMGSGALPKLIWTSRETTKSSFYPNNPILKCTKGEIGWWRLETFETLIILASSTVNPPRKFANWKKSQWSTILTEVRVFPHHIHHKANPFLLRCRLPFASQPILSRVSLHWLWTKEKRFTSACCYSAPKSEMWLGNTMVGSLKPAERRKAKEGNNHISSSFQAFFFNEFADKTSCAFICLVQETTITWLTGTKWLIAQQYSQWKAQPLPMKASTVRATWGTPLSTEPGWGLSCEVC